MPTEILQQLRTLREGIVEALKKDPRYLTLAALDKTIAEISGVLSASGLLPPEPPKPAEPLRFEPGGASPSARLASLAPQPVASPTRSEAKLEEAKLEEPKLAGPTPAPAAQPAALADLEPPPAPAAIPSKPKKSFVLKPLVETAAVVAAGALAAEVYAEAKGKPMGKSAPKTAASSEDDDGDSDEESEPASAHDAHDHAASAHGEAVDASPDEPHAAAPHEAEEEPDAADETSEAHGEHADEAPVAAEDDDAEEDHGSAANGMAHEAAEHGGEEHESEEQEATPHEPEHHEPETEDPAGVIPAGKASGYKAMGAKPGAPQYQPAISVRFGKLPNKVDLRPLMTPIEDQGETSSCVANAVAGAYEYWIKKASKQNQQISRLFVYYNARWRDNTQDKDDGSVIQLAMEGLAKFGACSEKIWPFDTHLVLKKPGADAYQDGAAYRVHDMAQVPLKVEAWKQALAEGKPIVFGCELFDSFDECSKRGGVVPMPAPDDIARKKHSGHSMCAVGYSDAEKVFIVRNSWGADWGDKGYCYMPYSYLMSSKFNDGDCWVFVPKVPSQPPREVWSDTTDPVTNSGRGVDFPIETYTIADYERIAVDLFARIRTPFNPTIVAGYGEYVSMVGRGLWSELEKFDVVTYLASAAALTGVASLAAESYLSETNVSETETSQTTALMSEESSDDDDSEETDDDAGVDAEDDDADDDAADDDTAEDDADEDADGDEAEDDAADDEADDDADEDAADDDTADDEADDDDADGDAADDEAGGDEADDDADEDAAEDDDDASDDEEGASDEDADEEGDDDDAEGDDDDSDDDGDDEGGDDDGGDDDGGGDDGDE